MTHRIDWTIVAIGVFALALSLAAGSIPSWIRFLMQTSAATALVATGVMILLRAGLLSLGQSLYYFAGGYAVALTSKFAGISDGIVLVVLAAVVSAAIAACLTPFIARYRGIFFSMLTLAISMVVFGVATKVHLFGGSDGMNVGLTSYFSFRPRGQPAQFAAFHFCVWTWAVFSVIAHCFLSSRFGRVIGAVGDNEVRVEFLGYSVKRAISISYVFAAALGGVGGALAALSARHVDPQFAYWTTAGDFVFVSLLSGQASVLSPMFGAFSLEIMRSYASTFFPDQWQSLFGAIMLAIVMFFPAGLDQLVFRTLKAGFRQPVARAGFKREETAS